MMPVIALYAMTALSLFAIWNCVSTKKQAMKATKKKDIIRLNNEFKNSCYGTGLVVLITIVAWII